jgi:hypothetical protein
LLEAITHSAIVDELALERFHAQVDRPPQQDIDVLERNRLHVRPHQRVQRGERRRARADIPDSRQIGIEVHEATRLPRSSAVDDATTA